MNNNKKHSILIVDDIEDNIISLRFLLEQLPDKYKIFSIMNGNDAIKFIEATPPDVVLLDINLPDINGYEVCGRIRKNERIPYVPVILLTALTPSIESKIKGYDFGADDFIAKPFIKEELFARIRSVLRLKDVHDRLRAERDLLEVNVIKRTVELSLITDNMIDTVIGRDINGNLIFINPAFEKITGYSSGMLMNSGSLFYISEADRGRIEKMIKSVYEGVSLTDEYRVITRDGREIWIEGSWRPMTDVFGKQIGIQGREVDITDRKHAEDIIKASLAEKEILLKEIHHRVKNNMQIICSLIDLQARQIDDPMTIELFDKCQHRIRSMALVHEKLYRSENFTQIDFSVYITELIDYLYMSYSINKPEIIINTDIEKIFLGIDSAIPAALIINELISNSLKHAFPGGRKGEIIIKFFQDAGKKYRLIISDNGIGMPESFDLNKSESLGLMLVKGLTQQLKGDFQFTGIGGVKVNIAF